MTHYFEDPTNVRSEPVKTEVNLPDVAFTMVTDHGVFSRGHLDAGTNLLLRETPPPPPTGDLLDLGCGTGAVALTLALRSPDATVWAVDVNERARELTALNAANNRVENIRVVAPTDVPSDVAFGAIWSNPPIRVGKTALHALLLEWLPRLAPGAAATLVVQKNLGADSLQKWLTDNGYPTTRLTSKVGFRLLSVTAAAGSRP